MIVGSVTQDGEPIVFLPVAGRDWPAPVDTGFNGDLELPDALQGSVNARYLCQTVSLLAGGQSIVEDVYRVDFFFDGQTLATEATFVRTDQITLGTNLLREYCLEIHFPNQSVRLERVL